MQKYKNKVHKLINYLLTAHLFELKVTYKINKIVIILKNILILLKFILQAKDDRKGKKKDNRERLNHRFNIMDDLSLRTMMIHKSR